VGATEAQEVVQKGMSDKCIAVSSDACRSGKSCR
jgi:hypothetical protein